VSIPKKLHQMM